MKLLNVAEPMRKRDGSLYLEPKVDERGRVVLEDGEARLSHQIRDSDTVALVEVPVGKIMNFALDKASDKLEPVERRKRFGLTLRIQAAMDAGQPMEMDREDEKRIEAAAELITDNHLFLFRVIEAIEQAELVKKELKAVN